MGGAGWIQAAQGGLCFWTTATSNDKLKVRKEIDRAIQRNPLNWTTQLGGANSFDLSGRGSESAVDIAMSPMGLSQAKRICSSLAPMDGSVSGAQREVFVTIAWHGSSLTHLFGAFCFWWPEDCNTSFFFIIIVIIIINIASELNR